ncbi:MAG: EAL domain-containing protein [Candidatus Izemoplasmataceae bacterium]
MALDDVIPYKTMLQLIKHRINQGEKSQFSLMMLSINHFDQIEEMTDEAALSEYMQALGKRLEQILPLGAKISQTDARETFLVYLPQSYAKEDLQTLAQTFHDAIESPVVLKRGLHIQKTPSLALIIHTDRSESVDTIIETLKRAIYTCVKEGGGDIVFTDDLQHQDKTYYDTFLTLKKAIRNHDLEMIHHPMYHKDDGTMTGVEIDLHWKDESRYKPFREFMPNLESTMDDYWMGQWMLEKALTNYVALKGTHGLENTKIIVPVGVRQFENSAIADDIIARLNKFGVESSELTLKILNPLQVNQDVEFIRSLIALQSHGIKLALSVSKMDDALYHLLSEYKINTVFIDQQLFNQNSKTLEMDAFMQYATLHDIRITVTNINNKSQIDIIDDDIKYIQGPYCSVPLTSKQLLEPSIPQLEL